MQTLSVTKVMTLHLLVYEHIFMHFFRAVAIFMLGAVRLKHVYNQGVLFSAGKWSFSDANVRTFWC